MLTDEPLFPLCLVQARLIGVIEAEQTQEGKTIRNDRMVAVAASSRLYAKVSDLDDLPPTLMDEIEQFFINYNRMRGRVFKPTARRGAAEGVKLVKRSICKSPKEKTLEVPAGKATSTRSGPGTSKLGSSPYEVYDCKLACETKAATTSTSHLFRALGEAKRARAIQTAAAH